jgi:hypothetical protein
MGIDDPSAVKNGNTEQIEVTDIKLISVKNMNLNHYFKKHFSRFAILYRSEWLK